MIKFIAEVIIGVKFIIEVKFVPEVIDWISIIDLKAHHLA